MLCVGAYELGAWLDSRDRRLTAMLRRGVVAFVPFIIPLILFFLASRTQQGGVTSMGTPWTNPLRVLAGIVPGVPYNFGILVLLMYFPLRKGLPGWVHVDHAMRVPLIAVGIAALAMPHVLAGVWAWISGFRWYGFSCWWQAVPGAMSRRAWRSPPPASCWRCLS